jgi:hypothetical protein
VGGGGHRLIPRFLVESEAFLLNKSNFVENHRTSYSTGPMLTLSGIYILDTGILLRNSYNVVMSGSVVSSLILWI